MGKRFGYARVSSTDQKLTIQRAALKSAGVHEDLVFAETVTGTKCDGRSELKRVLALLDEGDSLVVTRLDRLGRSLRDLASIAHEIEQAGASLVVTEQSVDTSTPSGRAFFGMLATFAQFETDVRRERQLEGIAKAKAEGVYKGRKPSLDRAEILRLYGAGTAPARIARDLGIARSSVYRVVNEVELRRANHAT